MARTAALLVVIALLTACSDTHGSGSASTTAPLHGGATGGGTGATNGNAAPPGPPVAGTTDGRSAAGGQAAPAPGALDGLRQPGSAFAPEVNPRVDPLSTFALDVDTASYTYARALLDSGSLPDPRAVRPEEFVNSFSQDYRRPDGDGFAVSLDGSRMPATHVATGVGDMRLMRVGLATAPDDTYTRPAAALTFVIDVSGSMGADGKLDVVQDALGALVEQLRPDDSVAIVTFNSKATVAAPMTRVSNRAALHAAIDRLRADGNTNLQAGLVAGYQVARAGFRPGATNRVIIASDGLANTGSTSWSKIAAQVRDEAGKQITLLGVGVGRDYGDKLMEQLVDHADGFVVYVSDPAQARQVFVTRLPATVPLRALDAKAQVTFDPSTVAGYRLIGYDDRALPDPAFTNDHVDGGEVAAGYTVTAIYAVRLVPGAAGRVAEARVRWLDPVTRLPAEAVDSIAVSQLAVPFAQASPRLQTCYAAAFLAEVLRGSPYGRQVRLADLAVIAGSAATASEDPAVADLADMIRRAAALAGQG